MEDSFRFRHFSVRNRDSALKVGTDAVVLGAAMTISASDRYSLDIGTGTGVIALMAAQRTEVTRICAVEIDRLSAEEAAFNFASSPWADRLEAVFTDLKDYKPAQQFDHIFSNPPYYDNSLKNPDAREAAARHTDSLSFADLCSFAGRNLSDNGRLSIILPAETENTIRRTAASFGLMPFRIIRIRTTLKKPVRRIILEFKRTRSEVQEENLILQIGSERSPEYQELTKDFYL